MSGEKQRGFTIIELLLFLGVTGALFASLIVGVNSNIGQQRYKESVASYKSLLQAQYAAVEQPQNSRSNGWVCQSTGVVQAPTDSSGEARGTSNCVLLGRYIQITQNGTAVQIGSVVGIEPLASDGNSGDISVLKSYQPLKTPTDSDVRSVDWQSMVTDTSKRASTASIVILRSPQSGLIRTFSSSQELPGVLSDMITETNAQTVLKNCVRPQSGIALPIQSVSINSAIGSANGVVLKEADPEC